MQENLRVDQTTLTKIFHQLQAKSFRPHPLFRNNHAQTVYSHFSARRFKYHARRRDEQRLFAVEPGSRIVARCHWQPNDRAAHPTLILVHGLEGSSESIYMLGTATKAARAGFNVLRLNVRTCGGSEHLTSTPYHGGLTHDLLVVINELIVRDQLRSIFLSGFSLGGNMSLKLAGELGSHAPAELHGVCAVSPSIDLSACADAIEKKSNWLYQIRFLQSLKRRTRQMAQLYPDIYNVDELKRVGSIREFDALFTTVYGGFKNVEDYYARASSLRLIENIEVPTLIIHAQDDPFVPFASFVNHAITKNPNVCLLAPRRGGHVGFIAAKQSTEDNFWAENRVVEFCSQLAYVK